MPRERVPPGVWQRLLCVCLVLAWVVGNTRGATGHASDLLGPCEPGFVQQRSRPRVTPVASRLVDTTPEAESAKRRVNPLSGSPPVAEPAQYAGG